MQSIRRDLAILLAVSLVIRAAAAALVWWPPYTDPAYYSLVAQRLATGHGFSVPVLWSFLEVGSQLPDAATLPVPSNAHWMPLAAIVAAAPMAVFGPEWRMGQVPMVLLSALLVPFTYLVTWELSRSRAVSWLAALLALFSGPLLIMYPTIDNFAVFGVTGAAAIYASSRAVRSPERAGWWLIGAGAAAGLATLARIDGVLLTLAPATAWAVSRGWLPWRPSGARLGFAHGVACAAAFLGLVAPWLARNVMTFGRPFPSTGGNTLWIRTYNEQFSIGHDVTATAYLAEGPALIIGSKLDAWGQLIGRTGVLLGGVFLVFFLAGLWLERHRAELAPFLIYFLAMFVIMGAVFTYHAPRGAYYHSAPAWLPWAFALSAMSIGPACRAASRFWRFLGRPATHRFIAGVGLAGAVVLSVTGSAILYDQWNYSRIRHEQAAAFLRSAADPGDVVMASDPASLYPLTGNPGLAAPFDPYPVIEEVVAAYDVRWVVVLRPAGGQADPLGLWHGSQATDRHGNAATWLPDSPSFEGTNVRVFEVSRE